MKNTKEIKIILAYSDYSKKGKELAVFIYENVIYLAQNSGGAYCNFCIFGGDVECRKKIVTVIRIGSINENHMSGLCAVLSKKFILSRGYTNISINTLPGASLSNKYIPFEITKELKCLFINSFIQRKIKSKV